MIHSLFLRRIALVSLVVFGVGMANAQFTDKPLAIDQHGIRATIGTTDVLTLSVDGVPFSDSQELAHMWPRWAGVYYEFRRDTTMPLTLKQEKLDGDRQAASFKMQAQGGEFQGEQRFEFGPGRKLKISVDCASTTSGESILEHMIGNLNPAWFAGRPFKVVNRDGSTTEGVVPMAPPDVERWRLAMADNFEKYTVETPTGPLDIVTSGSPLRLLDYRCTPQANGKPIMWFGLFGHNFDKYTKESYSVEFSFPPALSKTKKTSTTVEGQPQDVAIAVDAKVYTDRVIPTPKDIQFGQGNAVFSRKNTITVQAFGKDEIAFAVKVAGYLNDTIRSRYGVNLPVQVVEAAKIDPGPGTIVLSLNPVSSWVHPSGYKLAVTDTVRVDANTSEGLLNGFRTFRQLLRPGKDAGTVEVRRATVNDYPSMPFRGVYFHTGKNAVKQQARLISKVMGDLKMNALVYNVTFAEWKSRPDLLKPLISMPLDDMLKIKEICDRECIEMIPAIPMYGLKEWFRYDWVKGGMIGEPVHGQWNNPPELEALEAVLDEAVKTLKPKTFLICHDELHVPKEEVLASIKHWHKFLADRGVRTAIWGDLFLTPGEGADAANCKTKEDAIWMRDQLPKDVLIMDWHYADVPAEKFTSLKLFNDLGIDTVGGTGNTPGNILPFAQAVTNTRKDHPDSPGKSLGILVTTWAGRDFNGVAMEKFINALQSYVLGAEAAWTGGAERLAQVPFNYVAAFEEIWRPAVLPAAGSGGWQVDLSRASNALVSLTKQSGKPWLGYKSGDDLSALPVGNQQFDRFHFKLNADKTAVLVPGQFDGESTCSTSVVFDCGGKTASVLNFAVAATRNNPPESAIAKTTIEYADGTKDSFVWLVGKNVYSLDDSRSTVDAPPLWSTGASTSYKGIHAYTWKNRHVDKPIRFVKTETCNRGAGLLLFAVTGVK